MIVGTAGHVDHGKTSLVRALTGVDTDRLVEEKARGITIELGFAYARLDGDASPAASDPVGFVDVPGHRKFVQTMIAGAAGVDVGLLVVAADDGPMPQTREHLDILRWLGVPKLVVALSKVDRADEARIRAASDALENLLDDTSYRGAPIVPVSAIDGRGLDVLKRALIAEGIASPTAVAEPPRASSGAFRLSIDRAFVLPGIGLVVTGTCIAGRVAIDDTLALLPGGLEARVRGIHAQNRAVTEAGAGQRVALNVVGRGVERSSVARGHWIVSPALAFETTRIDVRLTMAASIDDGRFGSEWRAVRFHAGAASCNARVSLLAEPDVASGNSNDASAGPLAQVVFERPMHVIAGDRFVLRDATSTDGASGSIAGGVVLDVDVPARGRRSVERLAFLRTSAAGDARATLGHALDLAAKGVDLARWNALHGTAFAPDALPVEAVAVGHGPATVLFAPQRWNAMLGRLVDTLAAEHARAPDAVGPGRDRLRRMAAPSLDAATFTALVDTLKGDGRLAQTGAWLHLPEHRVELSADDRRRFERALPLLRDAAVASNPPRVRDVARALHDDEAAVRSLFVRLASRGELYRVAHDHYFVPQSVRQLAQVAADVAAADGVARAAAFRDRIRIGRKVAIQILEFFDRMGYTRRVGDDHRIIQPTLFDD